MSLNGLDAPAVQQVYNAALNEVGGWFFLKYVSRDEVELLDHGKGGVTEARSSVAQYEDKSPLYGLIMYRRKKVLIKYVPEGTSRLLQARTTVHLQDVLEKYEPYEAMVEVTSADSLSDTTLAAAFPLHTAAASIKGSLLDEITEDGEEPSALHRSAESAPRPPMPNRKSSSERWPSRRPQSTAPQVSVDIGKSPVLSQRQSVARFLVKDESGYQSVTPLDTPSISEYSSNEHLSKDAESTYSNKSGHSLAREKSPTGLSENGELDFEKYYAELYKPKVRLGPRPVNLSEKGRRPSRGSSPAFSRPVSTMPAGMHIKAHSAVPLQMKVPNFNDSNSSLPSFPPPPAVPDDQTYPARPSSRGSSRSVPASTLSVKTSKSTMTPEKMRLLKAMEIRKKQMRNSTPNEPIGMTPVPEHPPVLPQQYRTPEEMAAIGISKADSGIHMGTPPKPEPYYQQEQESQESVHEIVLEEAKATEATQQNTSASGLGIHTADPEPAHSQSDDPFAIDSPTLGRPSTAQGSLPRSPALASLHGDSKFAPFVANPALAQASDSDETLAHPQTQDNSEGSETRDAFLQQKRRGWVEPLTINIEHEPSAEQEHSYLSDDDFMEELQSATFQDARPMLMQRSPASPFFPPRRVSGRSATSAHSITSAVSGASIVSIINSKELSYTASADDTEKTPTAAPAGFLVPESQINVESRPQSVASSRTVDSERGESVGVPRKPHVSSEISKRIQALAEKSMREGTTSNGSSSPKIPTEKASLVNMRKSSLNNENETQAVKNKPTSKLSVWPAPTVTPLAHPNITFNRSSNRDSVSVTARIVRQPSTQPKGPASPTALHHSPLLINHARTAPVHEFPPMAPLLTDDVVTEETRNGSLAEPRDRPLSPTFSYSSVDSGGTDRRKSFDRKSFSSRYRSGFESPQRSLSKNTSTTSLASDSNDPDKASRTSRFFKRISHMGGSKRRSTSQAPMALVAEPTSEHSAPKAPKQSSKRKDSVPDIPPPIVVGDVNVQFPDTLLWKRRWAEIDSDGNLIFTATRPGSSVPSLKSGRGYVTKFHLKELLGPYIPDADRQEMPHSVLFDLADGATISCASEDSMAQRQLLSLLRTYHQAWAQAA